ncbi:MAG TPA: hypothetical protein VF411_09875 [Bacteroidia bacterium]
MKTITMKTLAAGMVVATMILFTQCNVGPQGAQGPIGLTGAAGTNGTNGTNGNTVQTFTGSTVSASWTSVNGNTEWDASFTVPAATATVVANGTIEAFLGDGTGTVWYALPSSYKGLEYNYSYQLNQVGIQVTNTAGTLPTLPGGGTGVEQFKFVVISPSARLANPNVNFKNYAEIKKAFNLKD